MHDPSSSAQGAVAAAWFVDPANPAQWRWWDGVQWTDHVSPIARQEDGARQQAEQEAARQAQRQADGYWPVPAFGTPLLAERPAEVEEPMGFVVTRRRLTRARSLTLGLWAIASAALFVIGLALVRVSGRIMLFAVTLWREALWTVRDDARDAPWSRTFARLGLDESMALARWRPIEQYSMLGRDGGSVDAKWKAAGTLAGMPAWCGELIEHGTDSTDSPTRCYRMFAVFELPPRAAARHRGVSVRRRRKVRLTRMWDDAQPLALESIDVSNALEIEVHASTDPVAARELFGSQLVAALADHPVEWDQRMDVLVVFEQSPDEPGEAFEGFLEVAAQVARAYWTDQD